MRSQPLKAHQEDRNDRGVYDKRNLLNDLTGKEWLFSTKTAIPKSYSKILPKGVISRNFFPVPVLLGKEFIETFSKPGERIFDPFFGVGTYLIGATLANDYSTPPRRVIMGMDNQKTFFDQFTQIKHELQLEEAINLIELSQLSSLADQSIDLMITDLPVWQSPASTSIDSVCLNTATYKQSPKKAIIYWLQAVSPLLLEGISKLKRDRYLVLSLPCTEAINLTSEKNEEIGAINFFLAGVITKILANLNLTLKSERIWFQPASNSAEENFLPLQRRFLIFRREAKGIPTALEVDSDYISPLLFGDTHVLHKSYPPSFNHSLRRQHGGMKPPELAQLLIKTYLPINGQIILDPFAGVGGTLIGAALEKKEAIGIDINDKWKLIYEQVSSEFNLPKYQFLVGDSRVVLSEEIHDDTIDLILTDVPYWAMDKLKKTRGKYSRAGEPSKDKLHTPLSKFNETEILSINKWLELLTEVFSVCYSKLKEKRYLSVFIGNMYRTMAISGTDKTRKGQYLLLSNMLADTLTEIGYKFQQELIWYAPDKALHVFGYPFSYIPSVVHQSILVFRK